MAGVASLRLGIGRHGDGRRAKSALFAPRQRACGHGGAAARGPRALDRGGSGGALGALQAVISRSRLGWVRAFLNLDLTLALILSLPPAFSLSLSLT